LAVISQCVSHQTFFLILLNVIMLNTIMLNVIVLNDIMLNVICIEIDLFEPVFQLPCGQSYTVTKLCTVHQTSRYTNCGVYQFDLKP
jgi:hypothetical protein